MKYADLLETVGGESCFTTGFLGAGEDLAQVRLQLSRWVRDGRIIKIHKGVYTLSEPYRKVRPELFSVGMSLRRPSYVSLQSALSFRGLIPEYVSVTTLVTTNRPGRMITPLGRFEYRHIRGAFFYGYRLEELTGNQQAFVAEGEKALLDLVYLTPGGESLDFLKELRLANRDTIRTDVLREYADRSGSGKLQRAASNLELLLAEGDGEDL